MPGWLFILGIVMVYWGMLHIDRYAGGFSQMVYGPYQSYKQLADIQPNSGAEMLVAKGEAVYGDGLHCLSPGQPAWVRRSVPALAGSEWASGTGSSA